eukprot:3718521-Rhodomonas_salina.1
MPPSEHGNVVEGVAAERAEAITDLNRPHMRKPSQVVQLHSSIKSKDGQESVRVLCREYPLHLCTAGDPGWGISLGDLNCVEMTPCVCTPHSSRAVASACYIFLDILQVSN